MKESKYYFVFFTVITISIFTRLFLLQNQSLWFDEGWSLTLSDATSLQENFYKIVNREAGDKYQVLYYLLLFYWRSFFGESEFAIRSLSALFGVASVIIMYFTCLSVYGKKHAFWSSLILAVSSFSVFYSQDARPYSLLIFIVSLQIYFFSNSLKDDENNKIISQVFFGIFTAIASFGSVLTLMFTSALYISHAIVYRNFKEWLKWLIPSVIFSSPMIWFYLSSPAASDPTGTAVTRTGLPIILNIMFVVYGILVGTSYGPPLEDLRGDNKINILLNYWPHFLIFFIVITVIFIALGKRLLRHSKRNKYQRADYLFALILITSFSLNLVFALVTKINWLPRHSFYLCVPFFILIPSAFLHNYQAISKVDILSKFAKIATVCLVIMNIYSNFNYYLDPIYGKDDYRSAVQYLVKNRDASARSVLMLGQNRLFKYYGDSSTLYLPPYILEKTNGKNLAEKIKTATNNAKTVFMLINREFYWKFKDTFKGEMSELYNLENEQSWRYIKMYKFVSNK
ncbi:MULTISPECIES: glycosyltransferase family 39 protein [Nostoc]|uniref:Glycosyltransferase family 39 protein n=1 Tax=Nostoc paludosum FACHB-159 TaxID=2692908 RepID=A0ABR8K9V9_9NOSO|nr:MULTISPECIES: glycosyltransferase family 39 protein [Nostoc]MBD2676729.1 glycosyltransferase family 39 protein [Nostoc sp. FACHB-857]MBD2734917.1 glycosyltransferase family 39 protein [Nostoc paludosum FACHB-159]